MRDYFLKSSPLRFAFPIDGDCIDPRDGICHGRQILLPVTVEAPAKCEIFINGVRASEAREGGIYQVVLPFSSRCTVLTAENRTDGASQSITVFRATESDRCFRISSDDNIRFLAELCDGNDGSIFDHPYLAVYKKAHDLYGAKVHLNLFYEFDKKARACFSGDHAHFDLSMMSDRYKNEFKENADWLKLAFHARSEFPDTPYKNATAEQITEDYRAVCREIARFADETCITNSTTVHWGEANPVCVRALRALGIRSLTGYFELHHGKPCVSYYAPEELVRHVGTRDFWYDTEEKMLFGRIDRVLNIGTLDEIMADLADIVCDLHRGGFVSLMIHEQYFYHDYKRYLPDFEERVLLPCRYLAEHGYCGAHISEVTESFTAHIS